MMTQLNSQSAFRLIPRLVEYVRSILHVSLHATPMSFCDQQYNNAKKKIRGQNIVVVFLSVELQYVRKIDLSRSLYCQMKIRITKQNIKQDNKTTRKISTSVFLMHAYMWSFYGTKLILAYSRVRSSAYIIIISYVCVWLWCMYSVYALIVE